MFDLSVVRTVTPWILQCAPCALANGSPFGALKTWGRRAWCSFRSSSWNPTRWGSPWFLVGVHETIGFYRETLGFIHVNVNHNVSNIWWWTIHIYWLTIHVSTYTSKPSIHMDGLLACSPSPGVCICFNGEPGILHYIPTMIAGNVFIFLWLVSW